jgi:N-carbamoyl-L-amino-acid hydrolase
MVDMGRLRAEMEELARIGRVPGGGISRPAFGGAEMQARRWFMAKLEEAGLEVRVDGAGNISGRHPGRGPALLCGSHLDTIRGGGAFDGALGVLAALECVRVIRERRLSCPAPVEVIAFSDEEEAFLGFLGSLAMAGGLSARRIEEAENAAGLPLSRAMAECGLDVGRILHARRDPSTIKAFVELHIEQGPILAEAGASVGVVEAIKGNYRYEITMLGRRDHAGLPASARFDPFFAVLELIQRMRGRAAGCACLMTVGRFAVDPGLENVIPESVCFSVDFRHESAGVLEDLESHLFRETERLGAAPGFQTVRRTLLKIDPVPMSPPIQAAIREASDALGVHWLPIQSGAGHDAQVLGRFVPTGMIFVPSEGGRSHCPQEHTSWADIGRAAEVLLAVLLRLAASDLSLNAG